MRAFFILGHRMSVTSYSTTASSNTTVGGVDIGENCSPANVNDAVRAVMADIATGIDNGDFASTSGLQAEDATLTALAGVTTAADKLIYATGVDAFSTTDITAYGRTVLGLASAAALRSNIGAVGIDSASLTANGYIKLTNGFIIQWGTATANSNGTTTVSFPTAFSSFSTPLVSGARTQSNAQDNNPAIQSAGLTSFTIYSAADQSLSVWWISVGV